MRDWLRETLSALGLNLLVLAVFLGLLFNWSPFWLEHPGAMVVFFLDQMWWLLVPVIALAGLRHRFGEVGPLVVRSLWDDDDWPMVTWSEPRFASRAVLFKASRVRARCFTRDADGGRLFCYQVSKVHGFDNQADCIAVPLASIVGFSVTTAAQLYRAADQRALSDGSHIILRAELDPPLPGGQAFIPLTFTAASPGEVEALHRTLSRVFAPGGLAARLEGRAMTLPDDGRAGRSHGTVLGEL